MGNGWAENAGSTMWYLYLQLLIFHLDCLVLNYQKKIEKLLHTMTNYVRKLTGCLINQHDNLKGLNNLI